MGGRDERAKGPVAKSRSSSSPYLIDVTGTENSAVEVVLKKCIFPPGAIALWSYAPNCICVHSMLHVKPVAQILLMMRVLVMTHDRLAAPPLSQVPSAQCKVLSAKCSRREQVAHRKCKRHRHQ